MLVLDGTRLDDFRSTSSWVTEVNNAVSKARHKLRMAIVMSGDRDNEECYDIVHPLSSDIASVKSSIDQLESKSTSQLKPNLLNTMIFATSLFGSEPDMKVLVVAGATSDPGAFESTITQPNLAQGILTCGSKLMNPTSTQFNQAFESRIKLLQLTHNEDRDTRMSEWFQANYQTGLTHNSWFLNYDPSTNVSELKENLGVGVLYLYCRKALEVTVFNDNTPALYTVLDFETTSAYLTCKVPPDLYTGRMLVNERQDEKNCLTELSELTNDVTRQPLLIREFFEDHKNEPNHTFSHDVTTLIPYISNKVMCRGDHNKLCLLLFEASEMTVFSPVDVDGVDYNKLKCDHPVGSIEQLFGPIKTNRQEVMILIQRTWGQNPDLSNLWKSHIKNPKMPRPYNGVDHHLTQISASLWDRIEDISNIISPGLSTLR